MSAAGFAAPGVQQVTLRDGRRLAYAEYGDPGGKPVFLCHGTPGARLIHPDEDVTAEAGVRLIAADRPGFGWSDFQPRRTLLDWPDDLAELADRLGIDRFGVVGSSGGGPYVIACAYKIPQRLTAAVTVCGGAPFDAPGVTQGMTPMRRAGHAIAVHAPALLRPVLWLASNPRRDPVAFFERFGRGMCPSDMALLARPEIRTMLIATYRESTRAGLRGLAQELRIFGRPWNFRLEDITMPVHFWHGELDASTPPAMARYLIERIPLTHATFVPDEGHLLLFTPNHWREIVAVLAAAA